jgi:hypothetical protein
LRFTFGIINAKALSSALQVARLLVTIKAKSGSYTIATTTAFINFGRTGCVLADTALFSRFTFRSNAGREIIIATLVITFVNTFSVAAEDLAILGTFSFIVVDKSDSAKNVTEIERLRAGGVDGELLASDCNLGISIKLATIGNNGEGITFPE